ncbi:MAG TPA: hemolysin III family protein [Acidimicrobiia bacterium]|nr:hemolysin III family protein [Acidimicrobiia bacterium]
MDSPERIRLGKMTNPVRGILHGSAALLSLVGAILLLTLTPGSTGRRLSLLAFGLSLVALFTTSSLYHSIPWQGVWKRRMQKLDHTMIYVLIAGTFTPIAAIVLDGWMRWGTLVVQWGIVAFGAIHKALSRNPKHWASVALATTQGWLALFLLWPLSHRLPGEPLVLMGIGGVCYTIGMLFLVTGRPRLWPRVFSYHEAFHVLVVVAAAVHFAAIAGYVARYGM